MKTVSLVYRDSDPLGPGGGKVLVAAFEDEAVAKQVAENESGPMDPRQVKTIPVFASIQAYIDHDRKVAIRDMFHRMSAKERALLRGISDEVAKMLNEYDANEAGRRTE